MRLISFSAAVAGLVSCGGGMKITIDYKPESVDRIANFKTYGWLPPPVSGDSRINNEFVAEHVSAAVDEELKDKGYTLVEGEEADFKIGFLVTIQEQTDVRTVNTYMGEEYGYDGPTGPGYNITYDITHEKGTLILDFVDIEQNVLIWRGIAQADVKTSSSEKSRKDRLYEAVGKILKEFPPDSS